MGFEIRRTGATPLDVEIDQSFGRFFRQSIANSNGQPARWHDVGLIRTPSGKYVTHVAYKSTWPGEPSHETAEVLNTPEDVSRWFQQYDPTAFVIGYPASEALPKNNADSFSIFVFAI